MQPNIQNGISDGRIIIYITKDANEAGWPPIILDINNITIIREEGECKCLEKEKVISN